MSTNSPSGTAGNHMMMDGKKWQLRDTVAPDGTVTLGHANLIPISQCTTERQRETVRKQQVERAGQYSKVFRAHRGS